MLLPSSRVSNIVRKVKKPRTGLKGGVLMRRSFSLLKNYRKLPEGETTTVRYRAASGKGGSALNATSNAARVTHVPTGLQVRCTDTRDVFLNEKLAHQRLHDLVEHRLTPNSSRITLKQQKQRKRNAKRRSRALKKYGVSTTADSEVEIEKD